MTDLHAAFSTLVRYETLLWNRVDADLKAAHDLPLAMYEVMVVVEGTERCRVHEVAAGLAITVGGASKVVDRLVGAGHAQREPNPDDRRSSFIVVTASGRRRMRAARTTVDQTLRRHLAGPLSDAGLARFAATVDTLRAGMLTSEPAR